MLSINELLTIFPQAKPLIREYIEESRGYIRHCNQQMAESRRGLQLWSQREQLELELIIYGKLIQNEEKKLKKWHWALSKPKQIKGGIRDQDIAQAKEVPIESLYEGTLRKTGSRLSGKCPFHSERTASFVIYPSQNSWWCYSEDIGGSVVDYIMRLKKCEFIEAVKYLLNP